VNARAVLDRLPLPVVVLSAQGTVRYANPAARARFTSLSDGVAFASLVAFPSDLMDWLERGAPADPPEGRLVTLVHGDQEWSGLLHVQDVREDPDLAGFLLTLEEARHERGSRSLYDDLTGLPTLLLVRDRVRMTQAAALRDEQPFAVAILDLDNFKAVNDAHGHTVGDELLVAFASRLKAALRPGDTVGRFGGDEFVLILPGLGPDAALKTVRRVLDAAAGDYVLQSTSVEVSASAGVCVPRPHQAFEDCLRHADTAMYAAKVRGRGGVELARRGLSEELRREREELDRRAHIDERTGLPNDASFKVDESALVLRARREGRPFGVLFVDIDRFHAYNARYKHLRGNQVLRQVAQALARVAAAHGGQAYRYGGEEFTALFPDTADLDALADAGEEMRRSVEALAIPHEGACAGAVVTVSVGVAASRADRPQATTLAADEAMLQAKTLGRNAVHLAPR
jgi:diguanylate cyclase (GGDEF)-like protein